MIDKPQKFEQADQQLDEVLRAAGPPRQAVWYTRAV